DLVNLAGCLTGEVGTCIGATLLDVPGDIKSVSRSFGDCETVVEGYARGNGTESNDDSPHSVHSSAASVIALAGFGRGVGLGLEGNRDDQGHQRSGQLANSLHGEHSAHHGTTPLCSCEPTAIHLVSPNVRSMI